MSYTLVPKPTSSYSKVPENYSGFIGRFSKGRFGMARFGVISPYTKIMLSISSYMKDPLVSVGSRFGIARFGMAKFGSFDNYNRVPKTTSSFTKIPL